MRVLDLSMMNSICGRWRVEEKNKEVLSRDAMGLNVGADDGWK